MHDPLHEALVAKLKSDGLIRDPRVEAAFRDVARHTFLPNVPLETVYTDDAILTKTRAGLPLSSSSQPAVMAIMLDQLDLRPGHRVLEIGAGTGYNAAIMAHIVGPSGAVVTMDIDEDIVDGARAHLAAAGFPQVRVVHGDGALGYAQMAPYDRIILTVSAWDIAPAWAEQLRPGGRLVLPLALNGFVQKLVAFQQENDSLASVSVRDGAFMPMRGVGAGPQVQIPLGPEPGLILAMGTPRPVDAGGVYELLKGPCEDSPAILEATPEEIMGGFAFWVALREPAMCGLMARGESARQERIPSPFRGSPSSRITMGLLGETGLALLSRAAAEPAVEERAPIALAIQSFGSDDRPARRLADLLRAWDEAGRPAADGMRITAYFRNTALPPAPDSTVILKPQTQLVLSRP